MPLPIWTNSGPIKTFAKAARESVPGTADFSGDPGFAVVRVLGYPFQSVIVSIVSVVANAVAPEPAQGVIPLTIGTPKFTANTVTVTLSGGQAGAQYKLTFTVMLDSGEERVCLGYLCVTM